MDCGVVTACQQHDLVATGGESRFDGVSYNGTAIAPATVRLQRHNVLDERIGAGGAREVCDNQKRGGRDRNCTIRGEKNDQTRLPEHGPEGRIGVLFRQDRVGRVERPVKPEQVGKIVGTGLSQGDGV